MSTCTLTARTDEGTFIHAAVIDLDQDINAQIESFWQVVRPHLRPAEMPTPPADPQTDPDVFALEAAVTAYRLTLAAIAHRRAETERAQAAAAALMADWIVEANRIKARAAERAAERIRLRGRPRLTADAAWLLTGQPDTPEAAAERAALDEQRRIDNAQAIARMNEGSQRRAAAPNPDDDPADDRALGYDEDDGPDEEDGLYWIWADADDRPGSSYREDWYP